jgi:hypothetical protein
VATPSTHVGSSPPVDNTRIDPSKVVKVKPEYHEEKSTSSGYVIPKSHNVRKSSNETKSYEQYIKSQKEA